MRRNLAFWDRLPFLVRLLATASVALLVAGSVMLLLSAGEEAHAASEDLRRDLAADLDTLPAALAEVVVVGDYSTLQQMLDRYVLRPRVASITFTDSAGVVLTSRDVPRQAGSPPWFQRLLKFEDVAGQVTVKVGGRAYGLLTVTLSAQGLADRAWQRLVSHIGVLVLAIGLDFLGIWLVLRTGLAPLQALEQGAMALAAGDLDRRVPVAGSRELRRVIDAFNHMAASLQSAQAQLLRRNRELVRFSEISAHHLQEPSRRLVIFSQRLRAAVAGDLPREELDTSLTFIIQEASRLRALLRDIELYLASPQPLGTVEPQDTAAVAREVAKALKAARNDTAVEVDVADLPPVLLDRRRLHDLFTVAIDNAIRYRRADVTPRIRIHGDHDATRVRLRIEDNGIGIDPDYRERVFRVFERLASHADPESTGVGLSIIRNIAETTGGGAWIEDGMDGGITLVIDLPLGKEP